MRKIVVLVVCFMSLLPAARADIVDFQLTGTFLDSTSVSGAFTVDTAAGVVLSADFLYLGQTFNTILAQFPFDCCNDPNSLPVGYGLWVGTGNQDFPALRFMLEGTSAKDSLVGYAGGNVCSDNQACGPDSDQNFWESSYRDPQGNPIGLMSGSTAPVPEPGSLGLLTSGILAASGILRRALDSR